MTYGQPLAQDSQNFDRPFIGHQYYIILSLSVLCVEIQVEKKILK